MSTSHCITTNTSELQYNFADLDFICDYLEVDTPFSFTECYTDAPLSVVGTEQRLISKLLYPTPYFDSALSYVNIEFVTPSETSDESSTYIVYSRKPMHILAAEQTLNQTDLD